MIVETDIDIDFADRDSALDGLDFVFACLGNGQRHPSGVYFQNIPIDPMTGNAVFDYNKATDLGYFKVDFLNNHIYENIIDEAHLDRLLNEPVHWTLFEDKEIVDQLAQLNGHFRVVQVIKPKSIDDLAVILALIRPGKAHLLNKPRAEIDANVWVNDDDSNDYIFRKSHSIAFATSIVVQLKILVEEAEEQLNIKDE